MGHCPGEEGVSEVVGVVLLVGLTVLAVAVAGVVLLSSPQPGEIPHATIVAGNNRSGSFALVHEGGDPLKMGEYRIYIDRGSGLADETENFTRPANEVWSIGGVLNHTDMGDANFTRFTRVIVTAFTGGGETILAEVAFQGGGKTFSPDPVIISANFIANVTEGNAPLAVQFNDTSTGKPTNWSWNFGDGNTSDVQHPEHTYTEPSNYTVSLTASSTYGEDTETRTAYITVLELPKAAFTANVNKGDAPLAVQFTDESTGNVISWNWDFGDGTWFNTTKPVERNATHTYIKQGTYIVTLTASNAYGGNGYKEYIFVNDADSSGGNKPVANFTATPTEGNAPLAVQFNDTSENAPTAWAWDFGDGATSTEQHPIHTYKSPGIYNVSLTAGNDDGYDISAPNTITVLEPPTAAFTATPTEGNAPLTVQFTDTSIGNVTAWAWDFGDGTWFNTTNPVERNATHTYTNVGTYNVTLNASNAYGYNISAPVTISVLELPAAAFAANVTEGNTPLAVQFTDESTGNVTAWAWDFGDGTWFNTTNPVERNATHTYTNVGTYNVTLNASNAYGYNISAPVTISVLELPAAAFTANVTEGNAPLAVQFTDESTGNVTAWAWDFGDGTWFNTTNPVERNATHTYTNVGTYNVTLNASNAYGYNISAPVTISVLELPAAAFNATPTEGNAPLAVQFTDESTGNVTAWLWDFGDGTWFNTTNPVERNVTHTYTNVGTYNVTLTVSNAYGYNISAPVTISVLELPAAAFNATPTEGNAPLAVQFTDESTGNVTAWAWDFGDGTWFNTTNPVERNATHTYTNVGTYNVTLNASNAYGYNISAPVTISVLELPAAAFNATPTEGNAPLAVQFTDESTGNVTAWAWDFGDETWFNTTNPVERNATHTYTNVGTYNVTLTVSNAYGYNISAPVTISVLELPAAAFNATPTEGNAPLAVQFTDESTGNVTAWAWDFGDGTWFNTTNPVERNATHTYTNVGTYNVTLNASNAYGYNISAPVTITVLEPPAAAFTANVTEGNAPLAVQFTDTSSQTPTSWFWDFGDETNSTEQHPVHTYESPGIYNVSLTASNAYGFSIETKTDYIIVLAPPVANFTANVTVIPVGAAVQFNDTSTGNITTRSWAFGDDTNTSTEQNPVHIYTSPGTYTVNLTVSNAYGEDTESKVAYIDVGYPPAANFTANVTEGNAPLTVQFNDTSTGEPTNWSWNFGDGTNSIEQHPIHTYTAVSNYTVTLNASNAYGYDVSAPTQIIVLEPLVAGFNATPTEGNAPLVVQFTDESTGNVTTWLWNFGDGNTSDVQNPAYTYTEPGNYTVNLTATWPGGSGTKTKPEYITVLEPPKAAFTANVTVIPVGAAVQFTDNSTGNITTRFWAFGDDTNTSTEQNPVHIYTSPGTYTVNLTVSNAYGEDTESKVAYIDVGYPPAANFTANVTEGNAPLTVQFNDTSTGEPTNWSWNFGDGTTSTVQNPAHTYATAGNYTVTLNVTNAYGNDTLTREDYIQVEKSFIDFIIEENVFVYGTAFQFNGGNVNGPGATIIVTGGLDTDDLNGGASISVSNIYIDGDATLNGGSAGLGSAEEPDAIYVNGNLTLVNGGRDIYGDVYVNGNFRLNAARIHGNVYVDGDLILEWGVPQIAEGARIYYTGINTPPPNYDASIIAKCIHQATVPGFTMPDRGIPSTKPAGWYAAQNYTSGGALTDNKMIFASSYSSPSAATANNVIIIASDGDISITNGWSGKVTGVFFAPKGKVTFIGDSLEGVVIARDGFFVESGGTTVTFKNIDQYISNPEDYPF